MAPRRCLRHRTLAQSFPDRIGIDAARAATLRASAEPLKPPQEVFRGAYSGIMLIPTAMSGNCRIPHSGRFMPRGGSPPPARPHHDSSHLDLVRYAGADLPLFLTHGPVRLAITGRTLSEGSAAGVAMGDGRCVLAAAHDLRAAATGRLGDLPDHRDASEPSSRTRHCCRPPSDPTRHPRGLFRLHCGASAPRAFPFHMGLLPASSSSAAWAHRQRRHRANLARCACLGNLALARFIDRVRKGPTSPRPLRQVNRGTGAMPIAAGRIIPLA